MDNLKSFIESGILESYVAGNTTLQENALVERMMDGYVEVRQEVNAISEACEIYALSLSLAPSATAKTFLMSTIDYTERLKHGETPSFPPELQEGSLVTDYSEWLSRQDMTAPDGLSGSYAKIIGYTEKVLTAIVWISDKSKEEVHDIEHERFLIVEGTCDITVEEDRYPLGPGDYFAIPLHKNHQVIVTSACPCKVILQRVAA